MGEWQPIETVQKDGARHTACALLRRIDDYMTGGGLFNPELANHEAVRDLLLDCRVSLRESVHG